MRNNNSKADRTAFNKGGGKGKKTRQPKINKSFPKRGKVNTEVTRDGELDASGRTNDPNWYFSNQALAEDMTQTSLNIIQGMSYPGFPNLEDFTRTSISIVSLSPAPGTSVVDSQNFRYDYPIMAAARRLYTSMSGFTGRTINYAPQDIAMYILAVGEVLSMFSFCRRIIGLSQVYNQKNRVIPAGVINAMHLDPDEVFKNVNIWRDKYNYLVSLANQLYIPNGIPYFDKCNTIFDYIYQDDITAFSQLILLVPSSTWVMDEQSHEQGTYLRSVFPHTDASGKLIDAKSLVEWVKHSEEESVSFIQYFEVLQQQIEALLNSSTLQIIGADMVNYAAKTSSLQFVAINPLDPNYTVMPVYNEGFMLQYHNMRPLGIPNVIRDDATATEIGGTILNNVYSDVNNNSIKYEPVFGVGIIGWDESAVVYNPNRYYVDDDVETTMLDFLKPIVTLVDRVEVARFNPAVRKSNFKYHEASKTNYIQGCGIPDHFITSISFLSTVLGTLGSATQVRTNTTLTEYLVTDTFSYRHLVALSHFMRHPLLYLSQYSAQAIAPTEDNPLYVGNIMGELNNPATVKPDYLDAILSVIGFDLYDVRRGTVLK